jgi:hypothetical protein
MITTRVIFLAIATCWIRFQFSIRLVAEAFAEDIDSLDLAESINPASSRSRAMVSLQATATSSSRFLIERSNYPENKPHVCLAFLSCCQRTDLLNHTIAGAIRHMEEDEPSFLRYELAWVDNGNPPNATNYIKESYPIEHALTLTKNMGLAYGMNLLINNLCTAPYILFLEEDWLYLDDVVADQTEERKRAIATSVALLEDLDKNKVTAFDGRTVIGTFLRHETYESFLTFPHADVWERREGVDLRQSLTSSTSSNSCSNDSTMADRKSDDDKQDDDIADIDYRIFCADTGMKGNAVWGSYTNGAGLYSRSELVKIGRQFGEPGDAFHDRYVEANFAYRVGLRNCHAALRLTKNESCSSIHDTECTGAFHHIGGGRGTRPRTAEGTRCMDAGWNFFGTPLYQKYHKFVAQNTGEPGQTCSKDELEDLRTQKFRDMDAESYREEVRKSNEEVFRMEAVERQQMRDQAKLLLDTLRNGEGDSLRRMVSWMQDLSDDDIATHAHKMEKIANSPHPLNGFWDSLGRIKKTN